MSDQPRPQGFLLDDFQNGGSSGEDPTIRHFENRRGEGPGDEVDKLVPMPPGVFSEPGSRLVRALSHK